jgi:hypothetical protein
VKRPEPIYFTGIPFTPMPRKVRIGRWTWILTDSQTGETLAEGTALTERAALRRRIHAELRCRPESERPKPPIPVLTWSQEQVDAMLARYAADLHKADVLTFDHMACAAECCTGVMGERMRALVDAERAERYRWVTAGITVTDGGEPS